MEDDLKKQGYSGEEKYFHKRNQELLEKLKKKSEDEKCNKKTVTRSD